MSILLYFRFFLITFVAFVLSATSIFAEPRIYHLPQTLNLSFVRSDDPDFVSQCFTKAFLGSLNLWVDELDQSQSEVDFIIVFLWMRNLVNSLSRIFEVKKRDSS